jgi:hypothetical protein
MRRSRQWQKPIHATAARSRLPLASATSIADRRPREVTARAPPEAVGATRSASPSRVTANSGEPRGHPRPHRPGRRGGADDPARRRRPHPGPAARPSGSDPAAPAARLDSADELPCWRRCPEDQVPRGVRLLPSADGDDRSYRSSSPAAISGERLVDANAGFDQRTASRSSPSASTAPARRQFAEITRENVGALRHRARRQGPERACDPRADHRRFRPDQRRLHLSRTPSFCRRCCAPVPSRPR